jgi:hypothetical protein
MKRLISTIAIVLLLSLPAQAADGCGDGNVPKGTWPNCEPCAGGGAQQNVKNAIVAYGKIMDETPAPKSMDFLDQCIAGINNNYMPTIGIPSLDDLLGALCLVARHYSQNVVSSLTSYLDKAQFSQFGGAVSGGITQGSGTIKVKDTSAQAFNAARSNMPGVKLP